MCDYSVQAVLTRDAKAGDQLVTKYFGYSTGFAACDDTICAVCCKEGTEIAFARGYALIRGMPWYRKIRSGVATFRKLDLKYEHMHHDALEFANGRIVRLSDLVVDQQASVLTLPVSENHSRKAAEPLGTPYRGFEGIPAPDSGVDPKTHGDPVSVRLGGGPVHARAPD
jgi:hypothetical protein